MFHLFRKASLSFSLFIITILFLASCTVVKNYPTDTPFVYQNNINLKGDVSKDEKKRLQTELINYWDDSLQVNAVLNYGVRTVIRNPHVFDSAAVSRSVVFMNSYLNSQGFYNAVIAPAPVKIDTVKDQLRTTVEMNIDVKKNLRIDSVALDTSFPAALRQLASKNNKQTLLTKNTPFTKSLISGELDRLVTIFRRNGYYKYSREMVYAEVDTTDPALLEISLDPFEQARKIAEAIARRQENPTINVTIKQRLVKDTTLFTEYYIGKINYYPETLINQSPDSLMNARFRYDTIQREYRLKQNIPIIKMRPLRLHTYLKEGTIYDEQAYFKTLNSFSQLGPWNQVDVRTVERKDTITTPAVLDTAGATTGTTALADSVNKIDFHFFLTPAPKYSFGYDFEISRNSGNIITGNLLGITNVLTLRNRNVWKSAVQSSTNIRAGVELGFSDTVLQTFQASVSQTYSIPRFILPWAQRGLKKLDDYKTVVNFNGSYTDRRNFYRLRSAVASWGYEWKKGNHVWLYRPINVELYSLDTLPGLLQAFQTNPFLRTAFNTGYVISQSATYSVTWPKRRNPNVVNNLRLSAEEAGAIFGRFAGLRDKIYQYIKMELEFRQVTSWTKTSFAYRVFGGIGINYSDDPRIGQSLPFFKQFVAGGPYSMRAWGIRQLGLGSSLLSDTSTIFRDRFGDIQLEVNLEYRYPLFAIGGVKVNSAIFTDIGNIWNLKANVDDPKSKLTLNRFYRDLAMAAGTGIRLDFNYFLVRVDFAYKVKDPARQENNGWMSFKDFEWRNREFENERPVKRNNFSFQLGIGLPF